MGNCTGVFGACVGEDGPNNQAIKRVDKDNMKKALAANQELNNVNDASFGNVPDPSLGGQRGNHFDFELSAKNHYMGDQHNGSSNAAFAGAKIQ